jgi:putative transposase
MTNTSSYRPKWHQAKLRSQNDIARQNGHSIWLWRAVDQDGYVLDEIVQNPPQYQGCQAIADQTAEKAGPQAEPHRHRQAAIIWRGKAGSHAKRRTPVAQRAEQSGGELSPTTSKTRTNDAGISIGRRLATLRLGLSAVRNHFVAPYQKR